MARSALVVVVDEAEPVVARLRLAHDPTAARGVPAHVTILHPFRSIVDDATVELVAAIAAELPRFAATFAQVGRFPGEVVFLAPEPAAFFSAMTQRFVDAFPDCPPYGGAFSEPIPHLTVGSKLLSDDADQVERAVTPGLPIRTTVDHLTLLVEDDEGEWTIARSWPLLGRPSGG